MLASNKSPEQTSVAEDSSSVPVPMSANDEAAAQAIASALSGTSDCRFPTTPLTEESSSASPVFLNPSDFLTSPVSPWDDLLTTPALDADAGMMPDIYTSPIMGMGFGDDFDNMPSLFGSSAYDGYDAKETVGSHLSPSDLPLPDMDEMYKISPEMPVIDDVSMQASPLHEDDPSAFPTRRKSAPTGTRKNITPEALVPYDAPIQTRKYRLPSSTSRKELPATFARKRARTSDPPDEPEPVVGPTLSEEDAIKAKRLQNTLAARRSRKRKLEYQRELEDAIDAERKDKEMWRAHALVLEALLRDKGHEVPRMIDA